MKRVIIFGSNELETDITNCKLCGSILREERKNGKLRVIRCTCQNFGKVWSVTLNKLLTILDKDIAEKWYSAYCKNKIRKLPSNVDYWLSQGFTLIQAQDKVNEFNSIQNQKSVNKIRGSSAYTVRSREYWKRIGFDDDAAAIKVKEIQTTNGIEYYTNKYGSELGRILFEERIAKWLHKIFSRIDIDEVNRSKGRTKEQHIEKFGLEEYLQFTKIRIQKLRDTLIKNGSIIPNELLDKKLEYDISVGYYTRSSLRYYFDIINPVRLTIGYRENHIDHIYSRHRGFLDNIDPSIIGCYINLRLLPYKDNLSKGPRCDITKEELLRKYETIDENWSLIVCNNPVQK